MDIAGVVLAGVSLLATAAENYDALYELFKTYHNHISEIAQFTILLGIERTKFQSECIFLRCEIQRDAPSSGGSSSKISQDGLAKILGPSYEACEAVVQLLNETLDKVTRKTKRLHFQTLKVSSGSRKFCTIFRNRMEITFKKSRLQQIIVELCDWNGKLHILRTQICTHKETFQLQQMRAAQINLLEHLSTTKDASQCLYKVLASEWSCKAHVYHIVSLDLLFERTCSDLESEVRFRLGITCWESPDTMVLSPLWLDIESTRKYPRSQDVQPSGAPFNSATKLESVLRKLAKSPRHVRPELDGESGHLQPASKRQRVTKDQEDLNEITSLCSYIRQMNTPNSKESCAVLLGKSESFQHLLYHVQTPLETPNDTKTLKELLKKALSEGRQYEWVDKLNLARILALSVLRFNSTNWLPKSWGSDDINFHADATSKNEIGSPCFSRRLEKKDMGVETQKNDASSFAPNPELFSLAVVLIELAYDSPFDEISSVSLDLTSGEKNSENFLAATKLASRVHEKSQKIYGDLVEKCLRCNFGVEIDLDKRELQREVLIHVVDQLDVCLEKYTQS